MYAHKTITQHRNINKNNR